MKKNWFTLHTDTFLWLKGNIGLAYNAENRKNLLFTLSKRIENICCQLLKTENLYTTELTDEDINAEEVNQWIHSLIGIRAGYLSYNVEFENRPVSLKPILKVQDKKEYYKLNHTKGMKGEILQNLHELTFYFNGSRHGSNEYFKQYFFPLKDCQVLDALKIEAFIRNCRNPFLSNINLVGNIFLYPDFEKFINNISYFSIQCKIHVMIQDFIENSAKIKKFKLQDHIHFNILVDSVFDVSLLQDIFLPFSITVFVSSEQDYLQLSSMFEADQNIRFIPLYNKKNLNFFESSVFIEEDELDHIDISKNDIFMRQALNIGCFGKLIIMPNGNVYSNVNNLPLGTIHDSPYSIVYKEFSEGKSWLHIRDKEPCTDCIYQWFCPSPSHYETVIGRPNLCHVKQGQDT